MRTSFMAASSSSFSWMMMLLIVALLCMMVPLLLQGVNAAAFAPSSSQARRVTRSPGGSSVMTTTRFASVVGDSFTNNNLEDDENNPDLVKNLQQKQTRNPNNNSNNNKSQENTDASKAATAQVSFPPPITQFERLGRAAKFWSTALPIVASYYGLMSRLELQNLLKTTSTSDSQESLWDAQHEQGAAQLAATITELKGFYVKTAQIISARQDLFPAQYTDALSGFTDNLDPMPAELAKAVIQQELLHADERFEDVFEEFDATPVGAASVAQVHRAKLTAKYGGKVVAVKVQRPSIESILLGDLANLLAITKTFRHAPFLPLDYYTVFKELESQLADEFDFVAEAASMERIYHSLATAPDGSPRPVPVVIPRPVAGLVSKRVLVMDYLQGVPLSRAREEMLKRGVDPESPEAKLFGRQLLSALTTSFGRTILETGFFHADPHPGNIFVLDDGRIGLIDFGQVKQISGRNRETLCKVMIALDERVEGEPMSEQLVGKLALELGVQLNEDAPIEAAPAVGIWLFDGAAEELPGGYDKGELSPNSPVKELKSFPQDLVLVGRSTILIKGLSDRLGIPWSLAKAWAPTAREVLNRSVEPNPQLLGGGSGSSSSNDHLADAGRVRFRTVVKAFRQWGGGRTEKAVRNLPGPLRKRVAALMLKAEERKMRRKEASSNKR